MARVTEAILKGTSYATDRQEALLDLTYGGQFGFTTELSEWISSQAYVRHNLFAFLLEAPRFFQFMPDPGQWVSTLKALVELHPQSIDGFNSKLDVEFSEHPIGGAGEVMHEPTNVKRAQSNITFNYGPDRYGMPITTFIYNWITYGIMDPETKYALAGTLDTNTSTDWLADYYTMTCIFIEPDPQHKRVLKSWLVTNMMPKATPDISGKRDMTSAMETPEASIEFTGITQFSLGVNVLAQRILDNISMSQANPYLRAAFIEEQKSRAFISNLGDNIYDSDVAAANTNNYLGRIGTGYEPGINTLVTSALDTKAKQRTM